MSKKRVPYTGFEVHVTGKTQQEHPQVFTEFHVEYVVFGDGIKTTDVERAIHLSETKYCSVSAMLRKSARITSTYRIVPSGAVPVGEEERNEEEVTV